jgi:hypothetical protein
MNKYHRYHTNPDGIIRLAIYNSINGDNTLLDDQIHDGHRKWLNLFDKHCKPHEWVLGVFFNALTINT